MRIGFRTTIDENLLSQIKIKAIQEKCDVNDIIEKLFDLYLKGDIQIKIKHK